MSKKHRHDAQTGEEFSVKGVWGYSPSSEMPHLRGAAFSDF